MSMSDWSKVTRPIPVPNEWTKPFWEAAKRGALELQRCQQRGHFQHPPYPTCVNCMGIDLKFEPVRGASVVEPGAADEREVGGAPYRAHRADEGMPVGGLPGPVGRHEVDDLDRPPVHRARSLAQNRWIR